nr:hypothetical protein [Ezakiella coagulans]
MNKKFEIKYLERAIYILNKIYELSGYEAYLVGGAVRDFLLNRSTSDFDVAINVKSLIVFKARFFQEEFKFLRYEKYYKSIKFIDKKTGLKFEFTPMRKEFYGKTCEPRIIYTDKPEVDSRRRDFKINAIYMDRNEKILDFTNGISDLNNSRISFIGSPRKRILEDTKRIIRALKFSELLSFKFQKETYSEIFKKFYLIKNISDDYKYNELKTIILKQNDLVFNLLCEIGFINKRIYEREYNFIKNYLEKYNIKYNVFISILIIKLEIKDIESFLNFLGFRNKQIIKIKELIKFYNSSEDYLEVCAYILNKYGADLLSDFYDVYNFIRIVWGVSSAESEKIDKIAKIIHNIERGLIPSSIREVDINGDDLMKIGINGALIGKTLNEIFKLTLVEENNQKENLLKFADIIHNRIRR